MINSIKIATFYGLFAIVATLTNISTQIISMHFYTGLFHIQTSIIIGTATGLIIKYLLDKKFIFKYQTKNLKHESKVFILYLIMGIFTTFIFWAFEFGFQIIYESDAMRYLGGAIGLIIGYILKYFLDKFFVFQPVYFYE